ncbi:MAG: hypothetical protein HFG28_09480 [Eubacterium sp.]|nr:hypothetical protein [Eubacterium sp.]
MKNELKSKIKNSIHKETYELMDLMEKTGENYLEDVAFLIEGNTLIRKMSKTKELLDLGIVNEIYSDVVNKIKQIREV